MDTCRAPPGLRECTQRLTVPPLCIAKASPGIAQPVRFHAPGVSACAHVPPRRPPASCCVPCAALAETRARTALRGRVVSVRRY